MTEEHDLVIRGARVVDGTGAPAFVGDVAVRDGRIVAVGQVHGRGRQEIDARGRCVAPGFIDVHTHCEHQLLDHPGADNFVRMGVTTVVTGNCGESYLNLMDMNRRHWKAGVAVHLESLIGHGAVRRHVMGNSRRDATTTEMLEMKFLVERGMQQGALGLSSGLVYAPGSFAKKEELIELARVVARYNGIYATHMRDESTELDAALEEALDVARQSGVRLQISHLKLMARRHHGQAARILERLEKARAEGIDVMVDQYVYDASQTSLDALLPGWAVAGRRAERVERLTDPTTRTLILDEFIRTKRDVQDHPDLSYITIARCVADPSLNGLNLVEAARRLRGHDDYRAQAETVLDLVTSGVVEVILQTIDEGDIETIARWPYTIFASDATVFGAQSGQNRPHPRAFGNNARVLAKLVREKKILTLEDAVYRMTGLPAERFGIRDRGRLAPGMIAEMVLFDPETVHDRATYENPHAWAEGIEVVRGTVR